MVLISTLSSNSSYLKVVMATYPLQTAHKHPSLITSPRGDAESTSASSEVSSCSIGNASASRSDTPHLSSVSMVLGVKRKQKLQDSPDGMECSAASSHGDDEYIPSTPRYSS